jgi:oligo-alginate lyase
MMQILLGMDLIRNEFSTDELDGYYLDLFSKEASLFDFFATRIYNIPVWIKCAQAMIGIFFDKPEQIQSAFYEKYGILDQLERGVTEDGLWYEGSMHYHFYALQPICYVLFMCRCRGFELPGLPVIYTTVEKMLTYPIKMIFRDRRFPNPNDAHPELRIDRYFQQYEYASSLFDNPLFREVCGTFYDDESEGTLTRLLFNTWPKVDSLPDFGAVNNASSYTAMLKTDHTELFIKYGQHTFLHMHPDVMNIEIAFDGDRVVYDLGNGGYASFLFAEWQRMTVAHNTVCLNMKSRRRFPSIPDGIVRNFDPDRNSLTVSAKGVYEASNFTRTVTVADYRIEDTFIVEARGEYTFDWMFYCKGDVICPYETVPVESLGDDEGYQHLFDIRKFSTDSDWYVDFDLEDKTIRTTMVGEAGTEVFLVNSYTHSTEKKRYGLAVRRHTENTQFRAVHECLLKT